MRRAAFFDMDKTLVPVNTGIRYARWRVQRGEMKRAELLRVLGWSLQYTLGLVDAKAVSTFAARTFSRRWLLLEAQRSRAARASLAQL